MIGDGGINIIADGKDSCRALYAWSINERRAVADVFAKVLTAWCRDWGIPDGAAAAHGSNAHAAKAGQQPDIHGRLQSMPWGFDTGAHAALGGCGDAEKPSPQAQAQARRAIGRSIFQDSTTQSSNDHTAQSIANEIAEKAWDDWIERLTALPCSQSPVPGDATPTAVPENPVQWDGLLRVDLPWCGGIWSVWLQPWQTLKLLAGHGTQRAARKNTSGLVDLSVAIKGIALSLDVTLAPVSLSLGRILDLRAGDIVALEHLLADPVYLVSAEGQQTVARGWLGRSQAKKVVELDVSSHQGAAE